MAHNLGFGGLAHVTKARPIIQAVSAALLEVPEQARLKLANAEFGTHRCSGSPNEFPLLCCFTTETSDPAIVSRIVALRSFVLLGVAVQSPGVDSWPYSCLSFRVKRAARLAPFFASIS
jgi:hypothetical protein